MNKLLVSDILNLNDSDYYLSCLNKNITVKIEGEVNLYLYNEIINKLDINLNENSILNIFLFNDNNENLEVNINQNNNSKINYNQSIINNDKYKLMLNNYIKGNNNESIINIRNISNKDLSEVIVNVEIEKNTVNNIALENLKGINNGGNVLIEPNIVCLSNEVEANHLTTIGAIDKDSINYLLSKGISIDNAKKILLKGFIFGNMDKKFKENFGGE